MLGESDCQQFITRSFTKEIMGTTAQYTFFSKYDPEILFRCTPKSLGKDAYLSGTTHRGVTIEFSKDGNSRRTLILELSLSGGNPETRGEIVDDFSKYLGRIKTESNWTSIDMNTKKEKSRYMFQWTLYLPS